MNRIYRNTALLVAIVVLLGFGCSTTVDGTKYRTAELTKIGFTAQIPVDWEESDFSKNEFGSIDYHEFITPLGVQGEDLVEGLLGIRFFPRIEDNELKDEIDQIKAILQDKGNTENVYDDYIPTTLAKADGLALRWEGTSPDNIKEVGWYTVAFLEDDVLIVYYSDELADMEKYKSVYDHVVQSLVQVPLIEE